MKRSYGHVPDSSARVACDLLVRHSDKLLGAPLHIPERVDHSPLLDAVPDQGGTSSCVGQAFGTSVYLRAKIAGHPIQRPSRRAIYDFARLCENPQGLLEDSGSMPGMAVLGMQQYGLVSDARWPLDEDNINSPPPEDVFQHALDATVGEYYRIESGFGCAEGIRQALAKGYVPAFAMDVDASYEEMTPDEIYQGPSGKSLGGHMQAIVGYAPGYFLIAGSWGYGFARNGFARISDKFFDDGGASDILVPTLVPPKVT